LIDPFIDNPTYDGGVESATAGATHIILTHGHDDHLGSTEEIIAATGAVLVANAEICSYFGSKGVGRLEPMNHGGEIDLGGFTAAMVPAWHSSSTKVGGVPVYLGNPSGIVISAESER